MKSCFDPNQRAVSCSAGKGTDVRKEKGKKLLHQLCSEVKSTISILRNDGVSPSSAPLAKKAKVNVPILVHQCSSIIFTGVEALI